MAAKTKPESNNVLPALVVTEIQIFPARNPENSRVKAFVNITFNGALRISGCRIIEGARGLFLSYPSEKRAGTDQYFPLCHLLERTFADTVQAQVLERFHEVTNG